MHFLYTPCPVCKETRARHIISAQDNLTGFHGWFNIVSCFSCNTLYTQPTCSESHIHYFYPSTYQPYGLVSRSAKNSSRKEFLYQIISSITLGRVRMPRYVDQRYMARCQSFLDYGCSNGNYLLSINPSIHKLGVEFNHDLIESVRQVGHIDIYSNTECKYVFKAKQFQIISAWMVLEHLPNPSETLADFRKWLDDEGCLVLSVPDAGCVIRKIFGKYSYDLQVPTHITHFTVRSLRYLLSINGFSVVSIRYQPDSKTLLFSLAQVSEVLFPGSILLMKRFLSSKLGILLNVLLGSILSLLRLSSRIEIIAEKSNEK